MDRSPNALSSASSATSPTQSRPHKSILVTFALLFALTLSACANAEPPALAALGGPAGTSTDPSAGDAAGADRAEDTDNSLAFSFDVDPDLQALLSITKDDGVCLVFNAWFDASFSPSQPLAPGSGIDITFLDDPNFAISTVDDGPFGAGWHVLITEQHDAAVEGRQANITAEQVAELDRLATEQCGYPVMTVLAVTDRQDCTTPECPIAPDPRPALRTS